MQAPRVPGFFGCPSCPAGIDQKEESGRMIADLIIADPSKWRLAEAEQPKGLLV
jgi:hypothetical protein